MKRGEIRWAELGRYRSQEQTGRRPVIVWQSDTLTAHLQSVPVVPLTTNMRRAKLAGTAVIRATEGGLTQDSVAPAFQLRAVAKSALGQRVRALTEEEPHPESLPALTAPVASSRRAGDKQLSQAIMPASSGRASSTRASRWQDARADGTLSP